MIGISCTSTIATHKYKFIYWKPYKTASTSIMHGLGKYCDGPNDMVGSLDWDGDGQARVDELDSDGNLVARKLEDYGKNLFDVDGTWVFENNHATPSRIREYLGLYPKRDTGEVMNMAINSTLSRTFNTSISTFAVLLVIFILGGEVIRGFSFALLLGVVVGTYSSICIATPIALDTFKKLAQPGKKR